MRFSRALLQQLGPGRGVQVVALPQIRLSGGIMAGRLIRKVEVLYPAIAQAARLSGTVVLAARISTTGEVEYVSVVSGPAMLQGAAIDAVKQWRYSPYTQDGAAVEVSTTITVTFSIDPSK